MPPRLPSSFRTNASNLVVVGALATAAAVGLYKLAADQEDEERRNLKNANQVPVTNMKRAGWRAIDSKPGTEKITDGATTIEFGTDGRGTQGTANTDRTGWRNVRSKPGSDKYTDGSTTIEFGSKG